MTYEENGAVQAVHNPGAGVKAPIQNIEELRHVVSSQLSQLRIMVGENNKLRQEAYDIINDLSYKLMFALNPEGYAKLCNPLDWAISFANNIKDTAKLVHEPEITKICDSIIKEIRDFSRLPQSETV